MKKVLVAIVALTVILTGCANQKTAVENNGAAQPDQTPLVQQQPEGTKEGEKEFVIKNLFEKGYYDYNGKIDNNIPIQMSIYPLEKDIVGSYFYEDQGKEITLKGKAEGNNIVLFEYDEKGQKTGTFIGTMDTVDTIEGMWSSSDNKKNYPFTLTLKSIIPGADYGKRYATAVGAHSDQEVEDFASKLQGYIKNNDKQQLAEAITYPIKVKINGKVKEVQNKADFIRDYDAIFHPEFKQAMSNASAKYMFANWQGVMLGEGLYNMWINEAADEKGNTKLMVIAINN